MARKLADEAGGMHYLVSTPRRVVTVYLPLAVFLFVLLFPFYWMAITSIKSNSELYDTSHGSPFWVIKPTLEHYYHLLFETEYPNWMWNTVIVSIVATFLSLFASVFAAYSIERLRFRGARGVDWRSSWPIWCRRRSCSCRSPPWCCTWACSTASCA